MRPTVRYLESAIGGRVAYSIHGTGPNLVLPAWWVSHVEKDWDHGSYREFLEALGAHFRIVRYDRLGVGLSDRETTSKTIESEVQLLAEIIDLTVGGGRTSLFAFSCGSPVALAYAADNADRLDKICIYGGYLDGADIGTPEMQSAMIALVRAHWGAGARALADVFLPDQSKTEIDAATRQQRDSATAETAAALLELTYCLDASSAVSGVGNELLILHRVGDRAIPCDAGRKLATTLPDAAFVELDGRAHPPWVGGRDQVLKLMIEFFTGRTYASHRVEEPGCVRLNLAMRTLALPEGEVPLTALEFGAMQYFSDNAERVVTRGELLEHVWKTPFSGSNKVDVLIRALRKKLKAHAGCLETVPGHGYVFKQFEP